MLSLDQFDYLCEASVSALLIILSNQARDDAIRDRVMRIFNAVGHKTLPIFR